MAEDDPLEYYASPGPMTDLAPVADALDGTPTDPTAITTMVQGLLRHPFLTGLYGVDMPADHTEDVQIRGAAAMVERLLELDDRPLTEPREPDARFYGNCRHFSTLTTALLRRAGIPARARCGFGGAFQAGKWVDHWVVEHWHGGRWVRLDAQIDTTQRAAMGIEFDPADLPSGAFLDAGTAWLRCRAGIDDPETFGILDMWGAWFIRGNLARDLAALNKVEMLPWDDWGELATDQPPTRGDQYVDEVAELATSGDLVAIRHRYQNDPGLTVPTRVVAAFTSTGPREVDVVELV
jgi:hypothetical protein